MVLSIIIPELNNKPGNTKDAVISILTIEWPLSLKGIYYKIKKRYNYGSSYQAVFKAVKELVEGGILIDKDKKYEINVAWIKKVQSFTDIVETNYYAKEKIRNISGIKDSRQKEDIVVLNFETILDAEKYLYYFMKSELLRTSNDRVCYQTNLEWRPIYYLRAEYNYYKRLTSRGHKFFFICSGKSEIERMCEKFYKSIGVNYRITNERFSSDVLVFGDYFISVFIPEDIKSKMRALIDKKDILKLLTDVMSAKSSIRIVITRDASLAEELKKKITNEFK